MEQKIRAEVAPAESIAGSISADSEATSFCYNRRKRSLAIADEILPPGLTSIGSLQRLSAIEQESYVSRI